MTAPALGLYDYQREWFLDRSRFKIGMFARQTGKTFTTTAEINDDCYETESHGGRTRWVILSRGERQAREAVEEGLKPHAKAYGAAIDVLEGEFESGAVKYKSLEVTYPGGSRVTALPANPDTARGFASNVFLDEFAFHADSRAIWKALFPVISDGYKIRITSTPNGKGNKFYELITGNDPQWSRHIVDIYRAVADGLPRDIDALRTALGDEDAWAQEFELKFLDEALAWLTYDLIDSCEHPDAGDPAQYQGGPCFIGNDIARRRDLWVAWVMEQVGDVLWTREILTARSIKFSEQDALLDELMLRYHVVRLVMDQTGMGEKPVEDAQRRYGSSRVEGVQFTPARRLDMATIAKQRFEDRRLRIPQADLLLRKDLHQLKKAIGPTGHPRLIADTEGDGHADRAWSCFMACAGASGTPPAAGSSVAHDPDAYRHQANDNDDERRPLVPRPGGAYSGRPTRWG